VAETPLHAQNHAAVAVAIALVKGHAFMNEFFEDYRDPEVIKLGKKAEVYTDLEIDAIFPKKIGTRLQIVTRDASYELFEDDKQPVPYTFIKEKFTALAAPQLTAAKIKKTIKIIEKLETLDGVAELSKLLK